MIKRYPTKKIYIGDVAVGGDAPISVQSMTFSRTADVEATVEQIKRLHFAGCDIVRVAVPDYEDAHALKEIKKRISLPLVADIHFNYRLALIAAEVVDAIRINPGNIGGRDKVREVVAAAKDRGVPIRIGVNAGSLEKDLLRRFRHPTPRALVESAARHIKILENLRFRDIKVSLKASDVMKTVEAYRLFSEKFRYPLHIGISEAGPAFAGTVKSAVGLGILLAGGIGDTMRVSLTADPVEEVRVAFEILKSLHLREAGPELVSCPTCGRCQVDIRGIAGKVEKGLTSIKKNIKVPVMGCAVNCPGEAREADVGIAGGKGMGILFKHGKIVRTMKEQELYGALMREIRKMARDDA